MDTFFRSVIKNKSSVFHREQIIKQTIIDTLSANIKEIQYDLGEGDVNAELDLCDHTQSLCSTIEAIFLHGLKDTFLSQTFSILSVNESNTRPAPNFWPPLLVFSHRHAIEQIHSFSQITSDIGYCRCWIRQTMNDGLLSSYISNIRKSVHALIPYYKSTAFVRDGDCMELAENYIGGIEACVTFKLPLNSSLLNVWPDAPLQLSGIYVPPLQCCPIASGIDVVNSSDIQQVSSETTIITNNDNSIPIPRQLYQCYMSPITNSPFTRMPAAASRNHDNEADEEAGIDCSQELNDDIEHDVRLNALLSKVDEITKRETNPNEIVTQNISEITSEHCTAPTNDLTQPISDEKTLILDVSQTFGNEITYNRGWSTVEEIEENQDVGNAVCATDLHTATTDDDKDAKTDSPYRKLLVRTCPNTSSSNIAFEEVWQRFEEVVGMARTENKTDALDKIHKEVEHDCDDDDDENNLEEYVVVQDEIDQILKKFTIKEIRDMIKQIYMIPRQLGLDVQNFACMSCENPLGIGAAGGATTAQLCAFTGFYFCSNCMSHELHEIPSRVICNWDFQKYPISHKAAAFLNEFRYHGFIDMKILNPDIYRYVNEMSELQSLRIQLNFIRAYLFTCCASIVDSLQKQLCNREYLYEHIHRYSLNDIESIPKGALADQLRKVISFGKQHIYNCSLCSQKGYICEICQSSKILYPFEVQTTIKCDQCGSVYHAKCCTYGASGPDACPKCQRHRIRQHESNLN